MYARIACAYFGAGAGGAACRYCRGPQKPGSTGDRSERIRTYNYPQGRVTDHRIGLTLHKLDSIVNGDLDELLSALITAKQSEQLRQVK